MITERRVSFLQVRASDVRSDVGARPSAVSRWRRVARGSSSGAWCSRRWGSSSRSGDDQGTGHGRRASVPTSVVPTISGRSSRTTGTGTTRPGSTPTRGAALMGGYARTRAHKRSSNARAPRTRSTPKRTASRAIASVHESLMRRRREKTRLETSPRRRVLASRASSTRAMWSRAAGAPTRRAASRHPRRRVARDAVRTPPVTSGCFATRTRRGVAQTRSPGSAG